MPVTKVEFKQPNAYQRDPEERARIVNEVKEGKGYPTTATKAIVMLVKLPSSKASVAVADLFDSSGPHTSTKDKRIHITFDCFDTEGKPLGRYHIKSKYKQKNQIEDKETLAEGSAKGCTEDQQ